MVLGILFLTHEVAKNKTIDIYKIISLPVEHSEPFKFKMSRDV